MTMNDVFRLILTGVYGAGCLLLVIAVALVLYVQKTEEKPDE